jgi:Asp-tRNA(Asn)/Glu-tRNA(Gln) amidotransferase A subunit family amidase
MAALARPATVAAAPFPEYDSCDAVGLAQLVRHGKVTADELLEAAIERIEAANPKLNAVVTTMYDQAYESICKGLPDGPFKGVPFLLKDTGATCAGVRNTAGSKLLAENIPDYDNELVKRYKIAGLVIVGRTNMPEFGLNASSESVFLGPARNPWNRNHSTGGSSGGAGAAVAARMVPMAHGGDGGGSIRSPSSCCGVFGMKPSRGRMPTGPDAGEIWEGFVAPGALTLSVRDNAALMDATSAPEPGAPYGIPAPERPFLEEVGRDAGSLKIAVFAEGFIGTVHDDCVRAAEDAAALCEDLGHRIEEATPPVDFDSACDVFWIIAPVHTAAMLDRLGEQLGTTITPDMVEPWTWAVAEHGRKISGVQFAKAKSVINRATRGMAEFLQKGRYDVYLTPTQGAPPPKLGYLDTVRLPFEELKSRIDHVHQFTFPLNITGQPAMSVPLFWNTDGLPLGVQFVGRYADEATLFRLAAQLEETRPWFNRRPTMSDTNDD